MYKTMWKNETLEGGEKAEERSETSVFNKVLFDLILFYYSLTSRYLCTHCQAHTHTCTYTQNGGDHTGPPYDRWYFAHSRLIHHLQ